MIRVVLEFQNFEEFNEWVKRIIMFGWPKYEEEEEEED